MVLRKKRFPHSRSRGYLICKLERFKKCDTRKPTSLNNTDLNQVLKLI